MAEKPPPPPQRPYRRYQRARPRLSPTSQEPAAKGTTNKTLESKQGQQKASDVRVRRDRRQRLHAKQESAAENTNFSKQGQQQDSDLQHNHRQPLAGIIIILFCLFLKQFSDTYN